MAEIQAMDKMFLNQVINLPSNSFKCLWPVKLSAGYQTSASTGSISQWGKKLRSTLELCNIKQVCNKVFFLQIPSPQKKK